MNIGKSIYKEIKLNLESKIGRAGELVIPADIRKHFGINFGSTIKWISYEGEPEKIILKFKIKE